MTEADKIYQITHKDSGRRLWTAEIADVTEKYRERMRASWEKMLAKAQARRKKVEQGPSPAVFQQPARNY